MKTPPDRFRDEALLQALDAAIEGGPVARAPLFDRLRRASGLPGPRMNDPLVRAFAAEVARRGRAADPLLDAMRAFHEDVAPFGHVDEILAVLGVAGTASRAKSDPKARAKLLASLEDAACDDRSRVRDEVTHALIAIGLEEGAAFAPTLRRWIDDDEPYLARAAVVALADADLLHALGAEVAGELLDAALERLGREHRGGRRHESFRRLQRALEVTPAAIVARFPTVSAVLEKHASHADEDVRLAVEAAANALRKGRTQDRAASIDAAIAAAKKPSRDPRWDRLPGKRGRGKR